jgi:hypothetical protein
LSHRSRAPIAFRPELRALLLAAHVHLDAAERDELSALAGAGLDFEWLVGEAHRHGIVPLLSRTMHALAPGLCPKDVLSQLRNATEHTVRASFMLAAELLRVLDALRAHDLPSLAIKGPISASLCYGDLGLRTFSDVDVLIDPPNVERVARCLHELGYVPAHGLPPGWLKQLVRTGTEQLFRHRSDDRLVDLHWALMPRGYTFSPKLVGVFAATQRVRIGGADVPTLGNEATLIFLLLHGMKHDWASLGWLCDVAELVRRQAIDWQAVLAWSDRRGPRRFIDIGLGLAHSLLDAPVPEQVLQRGMRDEIVGQTVRALAQKLFEPVSGDGSPVASSIGLTYFRAMQCRRDQLRFLHDVVLRPTSLEWNAAPLPPALDPLHYFVRPVRLLWKHARPR